MGGTVNIKMVSQDHTINIGMQKQKAPVNVSMKGTSWTQLTGIPEELFTVAQDFIAVNQQFLTVNTNLANEITRATNKETDIAEDLEAEVNRAAEAEGTITTALTAETNRAEAAEALKANKLDLADIATSGSWEDLSDVPTTFTPMAHIHAIADVTGLQTALNNIDTALGTKPSTTEVNTLIQNLIGSAPDTLNTLNELAAALGDDANFASTITTALGTKAPQATTYTKNETDSFLLLKQDALTAGVDYLTPTGIGTGLTALNASNLSGGVVNAARLPIASYSKGGTGLSSVSLGQLIYGSSSVAWSALSGNTTSNKKFLTQTGTGTVSAAPVWSDIIASDLPASGVAEGSYTNANITVDAYGRITNASNGSLTWGSITGTLSAQTDLNNALDLKVDEVAGKSLILDTEITRLSGIATGANLYTDAMARTAVSSVGYLTSFTETDPIFMASQAHNITAGHISLLGNTSGTNSGDETTATLRTKLGITDPIASAISSLLGVNHGDETGDTIKTKLLGSGYIVSDLNFTSALKTSYDGAVTNSHTHSNKTLLDGIISSGDGSQYLSNDGTYKTVTGGTTETKATIESKLGVNDTNVTALSNLTGINAGDETTATIKTKLGITTLSGSNTGDQDLSGLVSKTTTVNSKALSSNVTLTTADIADSTDKRYCTDAQKTIISNTSNTNTGDETNATIKTKLGTDLSNKYDSTNFTAGTDYLAPNGSGASLTDLTQSQISGLTTSSSPTFAGATIGSSTGLLEVNSGVVGIASAGTDYLTPSGSGASLTTLNASNISSGTLAAARGGAGTINGILKANGSGVVSQATSGTDYLPSTGGTGITTLGTIGTGTWNATAIGYSKGGSGLSTVALGQLNYGSSASAYSALAGNTTSTKKFLTQTGTGSVSAAPAWGAIANTDLPTSGATAGSYTNSNITVDTYGRTTSVSSGTNYSATSTETASYTLTSSDNGSTIFMNSSSALTLTVPSTLTAGFSCTIVQLGSGQVTFAGNSTTLYNRNSYTKTAGQYAIASIMVVSTSMFIVQGDMS